MADDNHFICRDSLSKGLIQKLARERDGDNSDILTDDELLASRRAMIPDDYAGDIWLFGYASLLWNPVVTVADRAIGQIFGHHRCFCLQTTLGRGTPEQPGLVLGLDHGGSCMGEALKLSSDDRVADLDLIWRREMISHAYHPRWVSIRTGSGVIKAITFFINRDSPTYVGDLSLAEKAKMIAQASGFVGPSFEYLELTLNSLTSLGINDNYLSSIYASASRLRRND